MHNPIVVCNCKNDLSYLKELLPYYRNIGFREFAFLDNGSTDGSIEYLLQQKDTHVYAVKAPYTSYTKPGWRLQVVRKLGLDRWYLMIDSDEFLAYPGMEEYDIDRYLEIVQKAGYTKIKTFMLDMYPDYDYFTDGKTDDDFMKDYRFYDRYDPETYISKQYTAWKWQKEEAIVGGGRKRYMQLNMRLDKTCFAYCTKGQFVCGNHDTCYEDGHGKVLFGGVFKHYKFIPSNRNKILRYVEDYFKGSNATEDQENRNQGAFVTSGINPYSDKSHEWRYSDQLREFPYFDEAFSII